MSNIISRIEDEIDQYLNGHVETGEGVKFSQYNLVRRIHMFKNKTYPTGKTDKQGRYKYWFDIIGPRRDSEVKNFRLDSKNFLIFSNQPVIDFTPVFIANAALKEWMWETGRAQELNEVVEEFSGDGNVLFKRVGKSYEVCDMMNTYIVNQTARTVEETPVIERHEMTQSELRNKEGKWYKDAIEGVIEHCGERRFKATEKSTEKITTSPYYEVYERNGEITEAELLAAQGKSGGSENKYVLAKVVVAGLKKSEGEHKYVLFADTIKSMRDVYKEAHRGPYKGRWWREGMYELLFDHQVRANEIGNQIARGLEWASKVIFKDTENTAVKNILTDVQNGTVIKSANLMQVETRLRGFDQLIADWNRLMIDADKIANSFEIVRGDTMPAATPFKLGALLDENAGKLFVFLRQKLTVPYKEVFKNWILSDLVKDLQGKDIVRITGDVAMVEKYRELQAKSWFVRNLVAIGPAAAIPEVREALIARKIEELQDTDPIIRNSREIWEGVLPRLHVTITGENTNFAENLETIGSLLQYEVDPVRRAWLLDQIYKTKGLDVPPPANPAAGRISDGSQPSAANMQDAAQMQATQQPSV